MKIKIFTIKKELGKRNSRVKIESIKLHLRLQFQIFCKKSEKILDLQKEITKLDMKQSIARKIQLLECLEICQSHPQLMSHKGSRKEEQVNYSLHLQMLLQFIMNKKTQILIFQASINLAQNFKRLLHLLNRILHK